MKQLVILIVMLVMTSLIMKAEVPSNPFPGSVKKEIITRGYKQVINGIKHCYKVSQDICDVTVIVDPVWPPSYPEKLCYYDNDLKMGSLDAKLESSGVLFDENGIPMIHKKFSYNLPLEYYPSYEDFYKKICETYNIPY